MPKIKKPKASSETSQAISGQLRGWKQIADFLGQPLSVAQRWAKTGMPVSRDQRSVMATTEELTKWLGRESGEPVHVAAEKADLFAELKRGLAYVRHDSIKTK